MLQPLHFVFPAAFFLLLTAYSVLPLALLFARPASFRTWYAGAAEYQQMLASGLGLATWAARIEALGFTLIGLRVEKLPLWGQAVSEVAWVAENGTAYASVVMHPNAAPASLYFYTPLPAGGMVFTRDHTAGPEAEGERLSVKNVPSADFSAIYRSHLDRLRDLAGDSAVRVDPTPDGRIAACYAFYRSPYTRSAGWRLLRSRLVIAAIALAILVLAACPILIRVLQ